MGSQDSVTSRIVYGNTISFSEIMGYLYSVTGQMATHFRFLISWAVNTSSPGHMATHSSSPISWSVKTPLLVVLCTATQSLFSEYMGSQCSVTGLYGHIFSYPVIMGSQDSVTGIWRNIFLPRYHGQSRLRHGAIWPQFFFRDIKGSQDSVTSRIVNGDTISFS
ncbi:hypothetical protein Bpfe_002125 [Biomphalaria pfeifferi]|uniref:Uncharacterized protein n=1 Tax=Biomphalaria pfeifferi TaxID=112525 RepID=A0AAD8CA40_BIOPF|nr:hypothetical protein Bpfe_002125 [Biomphalaria pfeifferi]